jgi:prolipoprotein diacylglyceryltransferase
VLAAVRLNFNPSTSVFGLSIRLETLALAGVILIVLLLASLISGRAGVHAAGADEVEGAEGPKLRRDDLILMAFGAIPGAVLGGRLGYALVHFDYYAANFKAIADPGQGGFDLTLAVVLGTLTAIAVARLLAAPVNRWLRVATLPVLLGLGLGKLATVLGGAGQGSYSDAPWATTYVGPGPWGSTNPSFSAMPSQALEGGLVLAVAVLVLLLPSLLRLRIRRWRLLVLPSVAPGREWRWLAGGRRYWTALGLWAVVRFAAAFTWRDADVLGPFGADQLVLLLAAGMALFGPEGAGTLGRPWKSWTARRVARRAARAAETDKPAQARMAVDHSAPVASDSGAATEPKG